MKLKYVFPVLVAGASMLATSCKESTSKASSETSAASSAAAEPKDQGYVLFVEGEQLPVGTVHTKTMSGGMKDIKMAMEMQGQKMSGTMNHEATTVEVITVDSENQLTIFFKQDSEKSSVVMNGQAAPEDQKKKPLDGKTVILTKGDDGLWSAKLDSGDATDDLQKELDEVAENINQPEDLEVYGTAPRKVGDTWTVDASKMTSFVSGDTKDVTGTVKVTFKSIKKHEGADCAELVFDLDLEATVEGDMKMQITAKVNALRSLVHRQDLKFIMDGIMSMDGEIPGGAGKMKMSGPLKMEGIETLKLP